MNFFKNPVLLGLIALMLSMIIQVYNSKPSEMFKSIDLAFVVGIWTYILARLFNSKSQYKSLFVVGWGVILLSSALTLTWVNIKNPLDPLLSTTFIVCSLSVIRRVIFRKLSEKFHGIFILVTAAMVLGIYGFTTYRSFIFQSVVKESVQKIISSIPYRVSDHQQLINANFIAPKQLNFEYQDDLFDSSFMNDDVVKKIRVIYSYQSRHNLCEDKTSMYFLENGITINHAYFDHNKKLLFNYEIDDNDCTQLSEEEYNEENQSNEFVEVYTEYQYHVLDKVVPSWRDIVKSDGFIGWMKTLSNEEQKLITESNNPNFIIDGIQKYLQYRKNDKSL